LRNSLRGNPASTRLRTETLLALSVKLLDALRSQHLYRDHSLDVGKSMPHVVE